MSSNSSSICGKIKWFKWYLYVYNKNVSCVDVPKPFEIQITFGSNTYPSVSEATLGLSLLLMSPGWDLASRNIMAPLLSVFSLFSPSHPLTRDCSISSSWSPLPHTICGLILSKDKSHGGDDVLRQNDLNWILTFVNLKIPGPVLPMEKSLYFSYL